MRGGCAAVARQRAAAESLPLISPLRGQLPPRGKPRLSKNSCRGEHCSPVPVCLVRKPSRKARCCAKLAGDQWSPLHSLYGKADVFRHAGLPLEGKLSAERADEVRPAGYCPQTGNPGSLALIRPCCARPPSPAGGRLYFNFLYNPQGPPPGLPSGGLIMGLLQLRPRGSRRQRRRRPSAAHRHRGRAVHRAAGPVPGRPAGRPSR